MCDDDEDDKKWKRAVRQVKEDAESKRKKTVWRGMAGYRGGYSGYYGASRRGGYGGYRRPAGMSYSGGRGFYGQGRYVEESREDDRESCDLGEKTELVMGVGRLDTYKGTAGVSSHRLEEVEDHNNIVRSADRMDDIMGFTGININ